MTRIGRIYHVRKCRTRSSWTWESTSLSAMFASQAPQRGATPQAPSLGHAVSTRNLEVQYSGTHSTDRNIPTHENGPAQWSLVRARFRQIMRSTGHASQKDI